MSDTQHRPVVRIEVDVFPDEGPLSEYPALVTPRDIAWEAWDQVREWVRSDYRPVVTVGLPDGTWTEIDLTPDEDEDEGIRSERAARRERGQLGWDGGDVPAEPS